MAITQNFNLNLIPDSAPVVVHADQYDEGEGRLVAKLYNGNTPYIPANGATAVIQGTKPDGKGFDYNASISNGIVTADLTKQMTAVAGSVRVQIVVTEGDNRTGTFVFILAVQKSALPSDTDMSESDFQIIEDLLEEAEAINLNPPKIGQNGNWWVWDTTAHAYVDSGVDASITIDIGTVTTLPAGSDATVSNSGTATDPIFNFGIPKGDKGDSGDGVPTGGTTGQFLKKKSNTDYDTEWGTLGTAAALNVAASGDASTTEVVKGDDSRLTDARNAADVSAWAKAANKPSYTASEVGSIPATEKGANSGVAELDANGKVPSAQLPSYVDDVLEYDSLSAFPATGETGKIYVAKDTNKTYRWSGTAYVEISESLALGETSSTAYAGNKGKANADAIAAIKDGQSIDSFADVETALSGKQDTLTFDNAPTANSNNPVKSQGIKTAIDDSQKAQESLLRDTVGWTGKNLCPVTATTKTADGITFTVNSDGSITLNGTCTLSSGSYGNYIIVDRYADSFYLPNNDYVLNGCPSDGASNKFMFRMQCTRDGSLYSFGDDIGNGFEFTPLSTDRLQVVIRYYGGVTFNNVTFKPMIRLASLTDSTYEPYHESVDEAKAEALAIAPVENGSTASRAYAVGEHFYRDGAFCTCISAIASGGSFTLNTNYTAGTVAECLDCKLLNSNFDLDNLYGVENAGLYYWKSSVPSNSPESKTWCNMEVYHQGDNNTFQKVIWSGEVFYMRKYSGNPMTWKPWYKFTGTIVT